MTDPVDTALRHYHRAGPAPGPTDLATIRQRVLVRTAEPDAKSPRPLRRVAVVVAASVVVAGAAATTITLWPAGTHTPLAGTTPGRGTATPNTDAITKADSVPATMNLVIERVANAKPLNLSHGGYLYTAERTVSVQGVTGVDGPAYYLTEELTERWSAVDEGTLPKLIRSTYGLNARPLTPADGDRLAKYGTDYTKVTTSTSDPATDPKKAPGPPPQPSLANPTPSYLASLPTDPDQLATVLRTEAAKDGPAGETDRLIFKRVSALATTADALLSPELRSALYQVLASVPGVERVPGQVDLAGRPGVAIAKTDDGRRTEIIIDPVSTRMIGFRMVALTAQDGIPAGTVIFSATANQKIVERLGGKA